MNLEYMFSLVRAGEHIGESERPHMTEQSGDDISLYIDLMHYGFTMKAGRQLTPEFRGAFRQLSLNEQLLLAAEDESRLLEAVLLNDVFLADSDILLREYQLHSKILRDICSAVIVVNRRVDYIAHSDLDLLYRYFVNAKVSDDQLYRFADKVFISTLLERLLNEERVIFTWIINNLKSMIQQGYLDACNNKYFFSKLFAKSDYVQGDTVALLELAAEKSVEVYECLISAHVRIDPFHRQTDYGGWLREAKKFQALAKLTFNVPEGYTSKEHLKMLHRMNAFEKLYQFERAYLNL
ncbi:hypothetical protein [Pseudomonas syringae]|uniref:Uncharacterized protein n=1 Tax=Pseudomonas syringae TaxID=317 RepID=A0A085VIC5_PSESX|nr:hypothetical protein [Pseudomonas syringae]KFE55188.1 hypothetical protein IV01_13395 [Pseudomonas syringae]